MGISSFIVPKMNVFHTFTYDVFISIGDLNRFIKNYKLTQGTEFFIVDNKFYQRFVVRSVADISTKLFENCETIKLCD